MRVIIPSETKRRLAMISSAKTIIDTCNIALGSNYKEEITKEENDIFLKNLNDAYNLLIKIASNQ